MSRIADEVGFIHLRVHSAYSLLEGALQIKKLAALATADRMPALGIADTGNLFGALEFSEKMAEAGVQPIVGCQLAVDFGDSPEADRPGTARLKRFADLVLIAATEEGYWNLVRLVSSSFTGAPAGERPHVQIAAVAEAASGLIGLTGGPGGPIDRAIASAVLKPTPQTSSARR